MRPRYSGLWEHKLLPGFVWASENVQPTLHWLFLHPYGDPTRTSLDQYSAKDLREPLCISWELSSSLWGTPSSKMCFRNSVLQSSMFWSQSFQLSKTSGPCFGFSSLHFNLEIASRKLLREIIVLYSFVSLLLEVTVCAPYGQMSKTDFSCILPKSHIVYSWKTIPVKVLHMWN